MSILIKPIITEKATADSEMNNRYTFLVDTTANKVEIKKAVEAAYGVTVDKVRTQKLRSGTQDALHENRIATRKNQSHQESHRRCCRRGSDRFFIIIFNSVTCQLEN